MRGLVWLALVAALCHGQLEEVPEDACLTMMFGREMSTVPPQTDPAPFEIIVNQDYYREVDTLIVEISSTENVPFYGFLIQARRVYSVLNSTESIGQFVAVEGTREVCRGPNGNALAHSLGSPGSSEEKSHIRLTWNTYPPSQGHIQFRATIVVRPDVFWVGEKSRVVRDLNLGPLPVTSAPTKAPRMIPVEMDTERCGQDYGCYRYPSGCSGDECEMAVMWKEVRGVVNFKLSGRSSGWVAVGFSHDKKMGDDEVVECVWYQLIPRVVVRQSENVGKESKLTTNTNVETLQTAQSNGRVSCAFNFHQTVAGRRDRLTGRYHIMLARGEVDGAGNKKRHLLEPGKYPYISPGMASLSDEVDMGSTARYILVKFHGIFMLIGWMMCASTAVLMAKYYKPMWPNDRLCGEHVWFAVHRGCQLVNLFCTIIAFILIFVHVGGYSSLPELPGKAHPILGIIVTILCVLNPLIALCRPSSKSDWRPVFNWIHWFFGLVAVVLATPTLFIGLNLHKAFVPWWATWVLVAFMLFHLIVELLLEIHGCLNARKQQIRNDEFDLRKGTESHGDYRGLLPDPVGTRFKKNVLTVYIVVVVVLGLIMIISVAAG